MLAYDQAGGKDIFEACYMFFNDKCENCDELGDKEEAEIDRFMQQYENAPIITSMMYLIYNLNKEIESEALAIKEIQAKISAEE